MIQILLTVWVVFIFMAALPGCTAQHDTNHARGDSITIGSVYDNYALAQGFQTSWGFGCTIDIFKN